MGFQIVFPEQELQPTLTKRNCRASPFSKTIFLYSLSHFPNSAVNFNLCVLPMIYNTETSHLEALIDSFSEFNPGVLL